MQRVEMKSINIGNVFTDVCGKIEASWIPKSSVSEACFNQITAWIDRGIVRSLNPERSLQTPALKISTADV